MSEERFAERRRSVRWRRIRHVLLGLLGVGAVAEVALPGAAVQRSRRRGQSPVGQHRMFGPDAGVDHAHDDAGAGTVPATEGRPHLVRADEGGGVGRRAAGR